MKKENQYKATNIENGKSIDITEEIMALAELAKEAQERRNRRDGKNTHRTV